MGFLSTLGSIAGAAIGFVGSGGNPAGAVAGAKIGGSIGGAVDGKKKASTSTTATQYIQQPAKITMDDIRSSGKSSAMEILSKRSAETKVAATAKLPSGAQSDILEDPWKPSRDWWEDLGGDPARYGAIDETRMP